eukprot:477525-Rhodomonas_salina.4
MSGTEAAYGATRVEDVVLANPEVPPTFSAMLSDTLVLHDLPMLSLLYLRRSAYGMPGSAVLRRGMGVQIRQLRAHAVY